MDKYSGLSAGEEERLVLQIEECGEVIQAATKVLRHGYESYNPLTNAPAPTNRDDLEKEIGQVGHALALLAWNGDIQTTRCDEAQEQKRVTAGRFLHHTKPLPGGTP